MQINKNLALAVNAAPGAGTGQVWLGGKGIFTVAATFGGGTVKLEMAIQDGNTPSTTWVTVQNPAGGNASLTANGMVYFEAPPGQLRANVTTATAVYAYAIGQHQ